MSDKNCYSSFSNVLYPDVELRLGFGSSEPQRANVAKHACSHCSKSFPTLQALGGHQTAHRKEMEEIRRNVAISFEAKAPSAPITLVYSQGKTVKSKASSSKEKGAKKEETEPINLELTLATGGVDLTLRL